MDAIDQTIITLLKENSRMPIAQIGTVVHLSVPAVSERIRKLKEQGIIRRFTLQLNREKTGSAMLALIFVTLSNPKHRQGFLACVGQTPAILECHHLAGEYDYMLKAAVSGTGQLEALVSEQLKAVPGVARTNTVVVLSTLKDEL